MTSEWVLLMERLCESFLIRCDTECMVVTQTYVPAYQGGELRGWGVQGNSETRTVQNVHFTEPARRYTNLFRT